MKQEIQQLDDLTIIAEAFRMSDGKINEVQFISDESIGVEDAYLSYSDTWFELIDSEGRAYLTNPDVYIEPTNDEDSIEVIRFYFDDPIAVRQLEEMGVFV